MGFYTHKTPFFLKWLYPEAIWRIKTREKVLFLTFDDGPIPVVTDFVLSELARYNAKATFFCVGENIKKHPEVFKKLISQGHAIGNHTYNHLKGTLTGDSVYFQNVKEWEEIAKPFLRDTNILFRPPYGRMKRSQYSLLKKKYKLIMWDVLSADFDSGLSEEDCYNKTMKSISPGSIIVFHDSLKAEKNLRFALPKILKSCSEAGYSFKSLNEFILQP